MARASQDREVDLEPTSTLSGCYDRLMAACPMRTQGGHFSLPLVPGRAWVAPAPGVCCERTGDRANQCRGFQMVGPGAWGSEGWLRAAVRAVGVEGVELGLLSAPLPHSEQTHFHLF